MSLGSHHALRRRIAAAGTLGVLALASVAATATGAAAAGATEATTSFSAPCVLGPGVLNFENTYNISTRAQQPAGVETGEEFSFEGASITIKGPAEMSEAFRVIGATSVEGTLTSFPALVTNALPASLNLADDTPFPGGLPFQATVTAGGELAFTAPSEARTTSWGPLTVTGERGQYVSLALSTAPAFTEPEAEVFKGTGAGIIASISGYNAEGTKVIGPLQLVCSAHVPTTLAEAPITRGSEGEPGPGQGLCPPPGLNTKPYVTGLTPDLGPESGGTVVTLGGEKLGGVSSVEFGSKTVPVIGTEAGRPIAVAPPGSGTVNVSVPGGCWAGVTAEFTYLPPSESFAFKGWTLAGSLTPKPLGQAITLPSGSAFNGTGELNTKTSEGTVSGSVTVPAFRATPKLFGFIPTTLGMTVTQSGAISGTIVPSKTVPGDETLTLPVKLNLGFTSIGLLGLNVPTKCTTSQPVSLTLTDTLTTETLLSKGWSFTGTATIPKITCERGLLGALYGETISGLISGMGASYSLTVKAPGS